MSLRLVITAFVVIALLGAACNLRIEPPALPLTFTSPLIQVVLRTC